MQETYYHVTPSENLDSIHAEGLRPSAVEECACGRGVHVTTARDEAELWCAQLEHEHTMFGSDVTPQFAILEITVDTDTYPVRTDFYKGEALADLDNRIICTESPLPPSTFRVVKDESTQ